MKRATAIASVLAVPVALFAALAGTGLHRQAVDAGGTPMAWGLAAALVLLGSVQLCLAAWSRSVIPTAVAGVICYSVVGLLATGGPGKQLVIGDVSGVVWLYGIPVVTLAMLWWGRRYTVSRRVRQDGRRGGGGGTSLAATTRSSGMLTSALRVRTVHKSAVTPVR